MFYKNVNIDNNAMMVGTNWVATPFVLNFGVKHGYDNDYLEYEYEKGKTTIYNLFGIGRKAYKKKIKHWARPSNYSKSFHLSEISLVGAPIKEFNTIQVLISGYTYWVVATWLDYKRDCNTNIGDITLEREDFVPLWMGELDKEYEPCLMSFCVMHFKYTAELFSDDLYIRILKDGVFEKSGSLLRGYQYVGDVRLDSGRSEESGKYDTFSMIRSYKIPDNIFNKCYDIINSIKYNEVFEDEE